MVGYEKKGGLCIFVQVQPNSKKSQVVGIHNDMLKIKIAAPPVDNKANEACLSFLSEWFEIPKSHLELIKGESSRKKLFFIKDFTSTKLIDFLLKKKLLTIKLG